MEPAGPTATSTSRADTNWEETVMRSPRRFVLLMAAMLASLTAVGEHPSRADDPPAKAAPPTDRAVLVEALLDAYGRGPTAADIVDPDPRILKEEDQGDHVRRTVSYLVERGERVNGFLLVPKPLPKPGQRLPLVLCPHPTNMAGKGSVVNLYDKPPADDRERVKRLHRQYALDLVRRGFVCFAPDRAAYGERIVLRNGEGTSSRWPPTGWSCTSDGRG